MEKDMIGKVNACAATSCAWNENGKCVTGPIDINSKGICLDFDELTPDEKNDLTGIA